MSGLSEHDPPPDGGPSRPPVAVIAVIAVVVIVLVGLHLSGVISPGSH